jgi:hypothetical protein
MSLQNSSTQEPKPLNGVANNPDSLRLKMLQEKSLQKMLALSEKLSIVTKKSL